VLTERNTAAILCSNKRVGPSINRPTSPRAGSVNTWKAGDENKSAGETTEHKATPISHRFHAVRREGWSIKPMGSSTTASHLQLLL
jgi:hypothetical protein